MPRLRRLRDPFRRSVRFPGARHQARKFRGRFRHRLLQPLPLLHEHVWLSHDSRTRARRGHGIKIDSPGPGSLGRHRRRRCALHRRQSHHSHAAAQCRHQSSAVQQPHLWTDEGPVFADFRISTRRPSPLRLAPSTARSIPFRWRSARKPPLWRAPWMFSSST